MIQRIAKKNTYRFDQDFTWRGGHDSLLGQSQILKGTGFSARESCPQRFHVKSAWSLYYLLQNYVLDLCNSLHFVFAKYMVALSFQIINEQRLNYDVHRAERSIKPFVIGRKKWLFAVSPNGAKSSAIAYSLVETAKENGLNPFFHLQFLFEELPQLDMGGELKIDHLMPWSKELPKDCYIQNKKQKMPFRQKSERHFLF